MDRYFRNALMLVCVLLLGSMTVEAAVNKKAGKRQINEFITQGSFKGGKAGKGFSLLNVKRVLSPSKSAERIIVEMGDHKGNSYSGTPGYFHAQLKQNPARLSVDFSQITSSKINQKKFASLFKNSVLVKKTKVTLDPEDGSANLTMYFKKSVKARIYTLAPKGKAPKVVVDFVQTK